MNNIRAFISTDIEDKEIIRKILVLRDKLDGDTAKIKFVEGQNLHLTLKFLGDVYLTDIEKIKERLSTIRLESFTFNLKGVGCFEPKFPRVIWVGVQQGAEELIKMQREVESKLTEIGFKPDKKRYSPHLTIGRVKYVKNKNELLEKITENQEEQFGEIFVSNFRLKKSILTPKGPIYEIIKEFKLEGN